LDEEIKEDDSYSFDSSAASDYDILENQENIDPCGSDIFTEI